jgi:predicted transcriptional regulator
MKPTPSQQTPAYLKKGFKSALDGFFRENVPQLGGALTRAPVVQRISEMVEEYFPATERLKMGQMIWYAVDEAEKAGYGKSLQNSKLRPVILDILHETDIEDVLQGVKKRERQKKVAVRLFTQSYEQKGVLTHADVASMMRLSPSTVSRYIREVEKDGATVVPRRGTIHDMGPTVTHKRIICEKHFQEGKSIEQTARETYHSPQAVVRYTNDFKRVRECLKEGWSVQRIAYTTGLSKSLTQEYVDMIDEKEILF